jgi:methylenetetrahydrofolate dehydrogenase (NADP+)/methenyltetrahydrofolate cyclohydrolase
MGLINCIELAKQLKNSLPKKNSNLFKEIYGLNPKVVIFLLEDDPSNEILIKKANSIFNEFGLLSEFEYIDISNELKVKKIIEEKNNDHSIVSICFLDTKGVSYRILNSIDPMKDVECINPFNLGMLYIGMQKIIPCTAKAVLKIMESYEAYLSGKHAVIIGRSILVGRAIASILLKENYTVTICHSHTDNLANITNKADVVISAIGQAKFLTEEYFNKDQIVIDIGVNILESEGKVIKCGDVDFEKVKDKVKYITPVPGVGDIAITCLLSNVLDLIKIKCDNTN